MRIRPTLAALLPMWALVGNAALLGVAQQSTLTYEQFAALSPQQRYEQFRELTDANKAVLAREHVNRWLAQNRWRLSRSQIAIVEELGSLLRRVRQPGGRPHPRVRRACRCARFAGTLRRKSRMQSPAVRFPSGVRPDAGAAPRGLGLARRPVVVVRAVHRTEGAQVASFALQ